MKQEDRKTPVSVASASRSIVVVGEDPLMVRTLNRLLRTAGYCVGSWGERPVDLTGGRPLLSASSDIALTIVDLPDDWTGRTEATWQLSETRAPSTGRVLWISAAPPSDGEGDGCLVKPFTSNQLLDKVQALLSRQPPL
jgi:hypothetical protein